MICNTCNLDLSEDKFPIRIDGNKIGLRRKCKICLAKWRKNYNQNNTEYYKNYRKENKVKLKELDKLYCDKNRLKIRETKKKYIKNKRKTDMHFKLRSIISGAVYRGLKQHKLSKNRISVLKILPYSLENLKLYLESKFEPWMTWNNWGAYNLKNWNDSDQSTWTWQIDHIIPQSKFNFQSIEELKKCWSLENLKPLSSKINVELGNRK